MILARGRNVPNRIRNRGVRSVLLSWLQCPGLLLLTVVMAAGGCVPQAVDPERTVAAAHGLPAKTGEGLAAAPPSQQRPIAAPGRIAAPEQQEIAGAAPSVSPEQHAGPLQNQRTPGDLSVGAVNTQSAEIAGMKVTVWRPVQLTSAR